MLRGSSSPAVAVDEEARVIPHDRPADCTAPRGYCRVGHGPGWPRAGLATGRVGHGPGWPRAGPDGRQSSGRGGRSGLNF